MVRTLLSLIHGQCCCAEHCSANTEYEAHRAQLNGNVKVHLHNVGNKPLTARIQDNSYKTSALTKTIQPGRKESAVLYLNKSYG